MSFDLNKFDLTELLQRIADAKSPFEKPNLPEVTAETTTLVKESENRVERPKRCQHIDCKAKLALTDFACQCTGFYCIKHRHAEVHACSFDYKNITHGLLEKQLVKTIAQKVDKI